MHVFAGKNLVAAECCCLVATADDDIPIAHPEMQAEYHGFGLTVLTKELRSKQALEHAIQHISNDTTYTVSCLHAAMLDWSK